MFEELTVSTPGRICLFGEHQDYLRLPVIPAAISLRMTIAGTRRSDLNVHIDLPDVQSAEAFSLEGNLIYTKSGDYLRSVVNVLRRNGFTFSSGFDCVLRSRIPIRAGTSSSSAFVVGWVNFLTNMSDQRLQLSPDQIARYAHEAEVVEFDEAGGMMDQFSTSYGGIIAVDFFPETNVEVLNAEPGTFVLGDSNEPKETQKILSRVKRGVQDIVLRLSATHHDFSLYSVTSETVDRFSSGLSVDQSMLLQGTVLNHEITKEARQVLRTVPLDHRHVGLLLNRHQDVLRDVQQISTPKINRMIDGALNAGALGAKINGSGGGGCMFAYAPENPERVAEAIERAGGKASIISVDNGTRIESAKVM